MRVLFLSPPQMEKGFPSLGIAYLTSVLNNNGHEAFLHDGADSSIKEMVDYAEKISPQAVGITMNTTNRFEALKLAKTLKEKFNVPVILGGPHPTLVPDLILKNYDFIDFIVRNEGEYSTLNLINAIENKKDFSKVLGISYKKDGQIIHNPPAPVIENLDKLPFPEWKFFDLKRYVKHVEYPEKYKDYPHGSIISSRGCPFRCTFCSSSNFWGHKIRFRSPRSVVDEMIMLYNLGIRFILFNDDNFTSNKKRTIEICKLIVKEGLDQKMAWQCRSEVNIIDEELVIWLKKANCATIELGVEDCTEEGINWFKKSHTQSQVKPAFDLCKKHGLRTVSFFIIGGDHETKENILMKKKYIEELDPDITTASILLAYPKTEVFELGKKKGLWDDDIWLKDLTGYKYHSNAPIYTGPNLSYSEVCAASAEIIYWWNKKKGYNKFNDNIKIALGLLKNRDFKKLVVMSAAIVKQQVGH